MKLVTFEVATPFGSVRRIGAVLDAELTADSRILDLNTTYGRLLEEGGDARWREIADAALPSDMQAFLEGGPQAMTRARDALEFARHGWQPDSERQLVFSSQRRQTAEPAATTPHDARFLGVRGAHDGS